MTGSCLEVRNLSKSFGGVMALSEFDLSVDDGELLCIIGPNGCGKTTFFNLISGFAEPSSGEVLFHGHRLSGLAAHKVARLGIGRKFQVPSVYEELTVTQNLQVATFSKAGQRGIFGLFRHRRDDRVNVSEVLEKVGLSVLADTQAGYLSHGQKQWLEIGMLLCTRPRLILLDEPTAGMTRQETRKTADLIASLIYHESVSIVLIEHDMWFVEELDCRVAVMMTGRVIAEGRYEDIRQMRVVQEAYLGSGTA